MATYRLDKPNALDQAGSSDFMALRRAPGAPTPIFVEKGKLVHLVDAIIAKEAIHLSGPTGSAKTSLIEALASVPANFMDVCAHLGAEPRPLRTFPVEMCLFESPAEVYQRRAISRNGATYDEASVLIAALEAAANIEDEYAVIWLREIGRVHAASIQGALLNIVTDGEVVLPTGRRISTERFGFIADSNYAAEDDHDATYVLVALDSALRRRFLVNIKLDYLGRDEELEILREIASVDVALADVDTELLRKTVALGELVRAERSQGNLLSLPAPTIAGYAGFLRRVQRLPSQPVRAAAFTTLLGNPSRDDEKLARGVFNQIFAPGARGEDGSVLDENLY